MTLLLLFYFYSYIINTHCNWKYKGAHSECYVVKFEKVYRECSHFYAIQFKVALLACFSINFARLDKHYTLLWQRLLSTVHNRTAAS